MKARATRRQFLEAASAATAAVAVSCLRVDPLLGQGVPRSGRTVQQAGLIVPSNLLTPDDFTYLGSVGLPLISDAAGRFGYSNGAISGRVVSGDIHLFVCQTEDGVPTGSTDAVCEVLYNGIGSRTTYLTNWGDVTKGQRVTGAGNERPIRGLLWDPESSQLFWAYGDKYNVGAFHDPSVGASTLTGSDNHGVTAYGPWRIGPTVSQKTRGYMYHLPAAMQQALGSGKRIASGAPITSGNATSPWGAFATAWAPPASTTAASSKSNTAVAIQCKDLIYTDINNKQSRPPDTDICGWVHYGETDADGHQPQANVVQDGSGCTADGKLCGAVFNKALTTFNSLDHFTAATWIDGAKKQGVVYIGQVCRTIEGFHYAGNGRNHQWYGPTQDYPSHHYCVHGQDGAAYSQGTGEATSTMLSSLYIYDPADLLQVAIGAKRPSDVVPGTDGFDMGQIAHGESAFPSKAPGLYAFGGCWFEPASKLLFVTQVNGELFAEEPQPIVHVFSVDC